MSTGIVFGHRPQPHLLNYKPSKQVFCANCKEEVPNPNFMQVKAKFASCHRYVCKLEVAKMRTK
jgi:hypothetical protein